MHLFYSHGASVVFGDLDDVAGENVAAKYDSKRAHFIKTDVTSYEDNLALFRYALEAYGAVDHAFAIAGVTEQGNLFDPALTVEHVEKVCNKHNLTILTACCSHASGRQC